MSKLEMLKAEWKDCTKCDLARNCSQPMFGQGNTDARLVLIGDAPSEENILGGTDAEELFNKILAAASINKEDVYITNVCLCPLNIHNERKVAPTKKIIEACRPRLQAELRAVKPDIVVLAGNAPLLMATGKRKITKNRGWVINHSTGTKIYATLHPASMLHGSEEQIKMKKQWAWEDWQEIARSLHD